MASKVKNMAYTFRVDWDGDIPFESVKTPVACLNDKQVTNNQRGERFARRLT